LLAGLVWLSAAVCRVRSSTTRHQLAKFVLWGMMLMPALMFVVPSIPVPESVSIQHVMPRDEVLPSVSVEPIARSMSPTNAAATAKVELNAAIEPAIASTPDPSTKTETKADPQQSRTLSRSWSWTQVLVCLWLSVTAALLIRVFAGWLKCRKILANVSAVELPVSIPCDYPVVTSSQLTVPATLGIINPKIVLPGDWSTWSEADLEMAVAHEASHIERNDSLTTLLSAINSAIHWFNPVSWILKWRLAVLAEHICDDAVIRKVGTRHEYAHCLVRMASRLSESPTQVSLGVGMARTALVEERVTMILDAGRGLSKRRGAIASLFTFVVIAFVAATTAAVGGFAVSEDEQPIPENSFAGI